MTTPSQPTQGAPHLQAGNNTLSATISPFQSPLPRPAQPSPAIPGSTPSGDALLRDGPAGPPQAPWEAETLEPSGVLFSSHVIPRMHTGPLGVWTEGHGREGRTPAVLLCLSSGICPLHPTPHCGLLKKAKDIKNTHKMLAPSFLSLVLAIYLGTTQGPWQKQHTL